MAADKTHANSLFSIGVYLRCSENNFAAGVFAASILCPPLSLRHLGLSTPTLWRWRIKRRKTVADVPLLQGLHLLDPQPAAQPVEPPRVMPDHPLPLGLAQRLRRRFPVDLAGGQHPVDRFHQTVGYRHQGPLVSDLWFQPVI